MNGLLAGLSVEIDGGISRNYWGCEAKPDGNFPKDSWLRRQARDRELRIGDYCVAIGPAPLRPVDRLERRHEAEGLDGEQYGGGDFHQWSVLSSRRPHLFK